MTNWEAKASFEENEKCSLEPGKYAYFVNLYTDLMNTALQQVLQVKTESTRIGGKKVSMRINKVVRWHRKYLMFFHLQNFYNNPKI